MSKLDHDNLLKFLSKPRFAHEVAEHYGISQRLASLHLRKVVKSGQVLVSERPVFQTLRDSNGVPRKFGGVAYVFRNSPMLANGWAKFAATVAASTDEPAHDVFSIRFVSKRASSLGKGSLDRKLSGHAFEETGGPRVAAHHLKAKGRLKSEFDVSSAKMRLAKRKTFYELLKHGTRTAQEGISSLSHVERTHLFQALLKEPLPFLDIHGRFGVSKQIIKGLVKSGLLVEVWGPQAIGVRFKLTRKGKIHLKELEAAARTEPRMREITFMRLKHRTPL